MREIWSVAIRGRPVRTTEQQNNRTTEQQNNRTTDRTRIGQDKFLPDNSSERFVAADKRKTPNLKIYDVYNKNIIKNSYCGTLTANCGSTTGCGCFFVFIEEKENGKISKPDS